nr:MAG TPA: hypothetical protein [Caudoviricetes sp.]
MSTARYLEVLCYYPWQRFEDTVLIFTLGKELHHSH